jgi:hypothetical protein
VEEVQSGTLIAEEDHHHLQEDVLEIIIPRDQPRIHFQTSKTITRIYPDTVLIIQTGIKANITRNKTYLQETGTQLVIIQE